MRSHPYHRLCDRIKLTPLWDLVASPGTKHSSQGGSSPIPFMCITVANVSPWRLGKVLLFMCYEGFERWGWSVCRKEVDSMDQTMFG